ncbi:SAF domain-containing protein (plasmid) [Alicyclobacillus acidoterrestris]|uniref:SAF domain-containing protein n=1 Tax=Alicyclobacillus acidoterrestris TaxID=1450 RepID=UPI003F5360E0
MRTWVKYTIAGAVFVIGVPGSIIYNQYLSPYFKDETVYVATKTLSANSPLVEKETNGAVVSYFEAEKLPRNQVSPGAITNPVELEGLYTTQAIAKNQQITNLDVEENPLALTPGTQDVPITSSWIAAMSPTIRQGDYVKIIPLPPSQTNIAVTNEPNPTVGANQTNGKQIKSLQDLETANSSLDNIPVLYVHTSDNQEVTNAQNGTVANRDNGSGIPNNLDLKMTNAQATLLAQYVQQGYKLFIWGTTHKTNPGIRG